MHDLYTDLAIADGMLLKPCCLHLLQKNDIKLLLAPVVPISEAQGSAAKSDGRLNGRITRSVGSIAFLKRSPFLSVASNPFHLHLSSLTHAENRVVS